MNRKNSFFVSLLMLLFWSGSIASAQGLTPIFQASFNEKTFSETGWAYFQSGPEFEIAPLTLGLIPTSPTSSDYSDGRGVTITAVPGQGSFVYGPVIQTGDSLVLMRLSVLSLAEGGTIAVGALNVSPGGNITTADGSVTYAYEADSGRFMGDYQYVSVLYRPKGQAIIPLFQLAVLPSSSKNAVTAMFDNFQVYLINANTITDANLLHVLGLESGGTSPTVTPTRTNTPTITPTPVKTPPPATLTPTPSPTIPPVSGEINVDHAYTLSPLDDQHDASSPSVAYDHQTQYALVAADTTGGYPDILLRHLNIQTNTVDGPYTVNLTFEDTTASTPDMVIDFSGTRHIVWTDNRDIEKLYSIYLTQVDSFGNREVESDYEVNDLYESTNTAEPAIAIQDNGDQVVCWRDDRNFYMDTFARRVHWDGGKLDKADEKDFQLNIPYNNTNVSHPDITMDGSGNIVAVWSDDRILLDGKKRNDVYARFFTTTTTADQYRQLPGSALEVQVSGQDNYLDHAREPYIGYQNGNYLVVWRNSDPASGYSSIHGALLNNQGKILQPEFIIDSGADSARAIAPSLSLWESGGFLITWEDDSTSQIFARIYDGGSNQFLSDPIVIAGETTSTERTSVASGDSHRALLVWDSVTRGFRDLYGISLTAQLSNGTQSVPTSYNAQALRYSPLSAHVMSEETPRDTQAPKSIRTANGESQKR